MKTLIHYAMKTTSTQNHRKSALRTMITLLITALATISIYAQSSGEIHGRITDAATGESIPGAHIIIRAGNTITSVTSSDLEGYFRLKPVTVGTHIVTVTCVGYGEKEIVNVMVDADKITNLRSITLSFGTDLPPVNIYWKKDLVDAEDPSKQTMDMIVVKKIPGSSNFSNILTAMTTDIYASEDQKEIHFRGSRANDAIYIVDGVKLINPGSMIPTRGIGNMTVYSGGVPAKYGDFTGGVIIVESEGYFSWLNKEKSKQMMKSQ
jgi:hypothetical protein